MDHHTALKLVPLQLACLKTSGCAEFGPLNTMKSDILVQNVFSQKWIKRCFLRNRSSYSFETCTIAIVLCKAVHSCVHIYSLFLYMQSVLCLGVLYYNSLYALSLHKPHHSSGSMFFAC